MPNINFNLAKLFPKSVSQLSNFNRFFYRQYILKSGRFYWWVTCIYTYSHTPLIFVLRYVIGSNKIGTLASMTLHDFIHSLGSRTPSPGGGSASAAVASIVRDRWSHCNNLDVITAYHATSHHIIHVSCYTISYHAILKYHAVSYHACYTTLHIYHIQ